MSVSMTIGPGAVRTLRADLPPTLFVYVSRVLRALERKKRIYTGPVQELGPPLGIGNAPTFAFSICHLPTSIYNLHFYAYLGSIKHIGRTFRMFLQMYKTL